MIYLYSFIFVMLSYGHIFPILVISVFFQTHTLYLTDISPIFSYDLLFSVYYSGSYRIGTLRRVKTVSSTEFTNQFIVMNDKLEKDRSFLR